MLRYLLPSIKGGNVTNHENKDWNAIDLKPEDIEIPKGSSDVYDVSYFPTPWARLYMVDYAFKKIATTRSDASLTREEKQLINWTLDLLELIFFKNIYNVELVFEEVPVLNQSNYFEKARKLFWNKYDTPILIKEKLPNNLFRIIGSTSPLSLVFPAYHRIDESYDYPLGLDRKLFDKNEFRINVQDRPDQFKEYLVFLKENIRLDSASDFRIFLQNEFQNEQPLADFKNKIEPIQYVGLSNPNENLGINKTSAEGFIFYSLKTECFELSSDYKLQTLNKTYVDTFFISEKVADHKKIFKNWPITIQVNEDFLKSHARDILPGTIIKRNWITESDIFADKLIRLSYELDSANFQIGMLDNNPNSKKTHYLLPLKDTYFQLTDFIDALTHPVSVFYDLIENYGKLTASTKLILSGFTEGYKISMIYDTISKNNILDLDLWYLSVFPNFIIPNKPASVGNVDYFVEQYTEGGTGAFPISTELEFYSTRLNDNNRLQIIDSAVRLTNPNHENRSSLTNYKLSEAPTLIKYKISMGFPASNYVGFLIPKFSSKEVNLDNRYPCEIAIDFGTSNTAIAIKQVENGKPQILRFNNLKEIITIDLSLEVVNQNAINTFITYSSKYFYYSKGVSNPMRSLICYSSNKSEYTLFTSINAYINNNELEIEGANKLSSEFKWKINNPEVRELAKPWVENYIQNILVLIKYELLASGNIIDYNNITLKWFYPLAFDQSQKGIIRNLWPTASKRIFPNIKCDEIGIDESIAPFFDSDLGGAGISVMNIDIGGGTTDICLMKGDKQELKLSLTLAARNIVGDLYSSSAPTNLNGIIRKKLGEDAQTKYGAHEAFILKLNQLKTIDERRRFIYETFKEASIIIWFFYYSVLKYTKAVIDQFYSGEQSKSIYPKVIRFSGNGSKLIESLLQSEKGMSVQEEVRKEIHSLNIFSKDVFKSDSNISIEFNDNPKEATVLGALKMPPNVQITNVNYELLGENIYEHTFATKLQNVTVNSGIPEIQDSYILKVFLPEFKAFLNKNIALFSSLSSKSQVLILEKYLDKTITSNSSINILRYIQGGVSNSGLTNSQIESSLLFFALQGIINELTRENWQ